MIWNVSVRDGKEVSFHFKIQVQTGEPQSGDEASLKLKGTHQYLECKPTVANAFDVKEKLVRICLRFVQGPRCSLIRSFHSDVFNCRNSHVRVSFQTERYDRYADEEDGYYAHNLNMTTSPE